jgi:hypothetical protein
MSKGEHIPKYLAHESLDSVDIWTADGSIFICSIPYYPGSGNFVKEKTEFVLNILNSHDRLVEALERIERMPPDDTGRNGCTYGDTDYDSQSVVYGYNLALDEIQGSIKKLLAELKS